MDDLIQLSSISPFPVAADESIRTIRDVKKVMDQGMLEILILKPMLLGGFFNTKQIIDTVSIYRIPSIISSSFETNIGRRILTLSASVTSHKYAHGLATSDILLNDPTEDIFPLRKNVVDFSLAKYSEFLNRQV